jgi:hypothetical protein
MLQQAKGDPPIPRGVPGQRSSPYCFRDPNIIALAEESDLGLFYFR